MDSTNIIEKIKDIISKVKFDANVVPEIVEPAPASLQKVTDSSGNEYEVSALEVGAVMTLDGVPVPEGTYEVEGNYKVMVDVDGVITEISELVPEPITEVTEVEQVEDTRIETLQSQVTNLSAQIETLKSSIEVAFSATKTAIEEVANLPIQAPIHEVPSVSKKEFAKNVNRANLSQAIKSINNK